MTPRPSMFLLFYMKPFLCEDGWIYFIAYDRQLKLLATTIFDMYCAETKDRMKSVKGGINMVRFSDLAILQWNLAASFCSE